MSETDPRKGPTSGGEPGGAGEPARVTSVPDAVFTDAKIAPPAKRRPWRRFLLGAPKNPLDPRIFHHLSLITLFAWVGLGADGLSSSAYGPEEAFLALGEHRYLALYLAIATALTVAIISASQNQIIQLFPHGGGGYVVSTKLLGEGAGLVAGSALVIDYVLTIAISVASGIDAVLSFLPRNLLVYKLFGVCVVVFLLTWLNLRGVKESVKILFPIFMLFVITHVALLAIGIATKADHLGPMIAQTATETSGAIEGGTLVAMFLLLMRAYCIGGGTYTGIEAVSTSLAILREPRERTGRNTLISMAVSLAITASALIVCYLLYDVHHEAGRTLNATLTETISAGWSIAGQPIGRAFLVATLLAEGALLFVAAQSGFIAGPRVLASMAVDGWVPRRFAYLSDRLVTQHGVAFMGGLSLLMLLVTRGSVKVLVILYSVNVFLVFTVSQLGMLSHWWRVRATTPEWRGKLLVNGIGLACTGTVLVFNLFVKFFHGAWVTAILTGGFIFLCTRVKRHYAGVRRHLKELDATLANLPPSLLRPPKVTAEHRGAAIILVGGYGGLGVHTLLTVIRLFGALHDRYIFACVGEIDSSRFKGRDEVEGLRKSTTEHLEKYLRLARNLGLTAEMRMSLGTDPIPELEKICLEVGKQYPRSVVYAGQLLFQEEGTLSRFLHNQAAFALQRRLIFQGQQMMILPIRVWETKKGAKKKGAGAGGAAAARAGGAAAAPGRVPPTRPPDGAR